MVCWHCRRTAVGACRFCGRGVCEDHAQERAFVLTPLAELAPDAVHPVLQQTAQQLSYALDARDEVVRVAGPAWVTPPGDGAERAADHSGNPASS